MVNRVLKLKENTPGDGPVIYWMSRDQRTTDNWALVMAQVEALKRQKPLIVVFCLVKDYLNAIKNQFNFMLRGLSEVNQNLKNKGISFYLIEGEPKEQILKVVKDLNAGTLYTDFNPLKISRQWKSHVAENIEIPFLEVDTHNIVPCFLASAKQEFGAYTIRSKIKLRLDESLTEMPQISYHPYKPNNGDKISEEYSVKTEDFFLKMDSELKSIKNSGQNHALEVMKTFLMQGIINYEQRNNPVEDVCSGLSPYIHFGQISPQRIALEVKKINLPQTADFLEELIIRRELSDNFCYYNSNYDKFEGFPNWAKESLNKHRNDLRTFIYSKEDFEDARTHDKLWNAAQIQMVKSGKMHGYLRMYWAKKILEWTPSPEVALEYAIYLNDKYSLDGRDPNGYAGIAWSIGGVHDRAWGERPVFGKVRYMSYDGCKRKFDIEAYINKVELKPSF